MDDSVGEQIYIDYTIIIIICFIRLQVDGWGREGLVLVVV